MHRLSLRTTTTMALNAIQHSTRGYCRQVHCCEGHFKTQRKSFNCILKNLYHCVTEAIFSGCFSAHMPTSDMWAKKCRWRKGTRTSSHMDRSQEGMLEGESYVRSTPSSLALAAVLLPQSTASFKQMSSFYMTEVEISEELCLRRTRRHRRKSLAASTNL